MMHTNQEGTLKTGILGGGNAGLALYALMSNSQDFEPILLASQGHMPFDPSHENMASLLLHRDQPKHLLAAHLRQAFSGIVAGNVKPDTIKAVRKRGPFEINGEAEIMQALDAMLASFVEQSRMKLPGPVYHPCYRVIA